MNAIGANLFIYILNKAKCDSIFAIPLQIKPLASAKRQRRNVFSQTTKLVTLEE